MRVGMYRARVWHKGQIQTCGHCNKTSHFLKDCPVRKALFETPLPEQTHNDNNGDSAPQNVEDEGTDQESTENSDDDDSEDSEESDESEETIDDEQESNKSITQDATDTTQQAENNQKPIDKPEGILEQCSSPSQTENIINNKQESDKTNTQDTTDNTQQQENTIENAMEQSSSPLIGQKEKEITILASQKGSPGQEAP